VPARWIVDGMNVIAARPDGWWRDRPGAVRRLHEALLRAAAGGGGPVVLVLDAPGRDLADEAGSGVRTIVAPGPGPDAADREIARLVEADPEPGEILVVTSDAALADRVRGLGARVEGAGTFRRRLGFR
jgi:uncharacterized protein YaiI (UPF0178 family)